MQFYNVYSSPRRFLPLPWYAANLFCVLLHPNIKGKFTDNKIIFLAALKAEDNIIELEQTIENQNKVIASSNSQQVQIDDKIREIINLKDQLHSLNKSNQKLEELNKITMNEFEKLNKKLISLIDKIINANNNNDNDKNN